MVRNILNIRYNTITFDVVMEEQFICKQKIQIFNNSYYNACVYFSLTITAVTLPTDLITH